jgi:F-type H+-transporting ATPase subunit a
MTGAKTWGCLALALLLFVASVGMAAAPPGGDDHGHAYDPKPQDEFQDTSVHHKDKDRGHFWPFFEHLFSSEDYLFGKKKGDPELHGAVGLELPTIPLFGYPLKITKFMILELIAAALILLIYIPLARSIKDGALPKGRWWNFFEVLLVFIRDQVARPSIGGAHPHHDEHHPVTQPHGEAPHTHSHASLDDHGGDRAPTHGMGEDVPDYLLGGHPADAYVPLLWTMFLFILFCNLLGMVPTMGSPTASIWVTGGLALISFFAIHFIVIQRAGVQGFLKTLWPHIEMPPGALFKVMGFFITLLLAVIEFFGLIIKAFVLAVRLFANMFAGHMVLGNLLLFIVVVGKSFGPGMMWSGVTIASLLGVVALSLLELFVAFLQAYIFTFLTALFIGMQLSHAEHH